MERLGLFLCRFDDHHPNQLTQVAAFPLPTADVRTLQPETALDELEATTQQIGQAILRRALQAQWELIDTALTTAYCQEHAPGEVARDGHVSLTVASRFGTVEISRQVLTHSSATAHVVPGNAVLPEHEGIIITRGLQEWACLLPQDLSFAPVARLLGWQTQEAQILSDTTVRTLVRRHGQLIRQAEQEEVASLLEREDLATLTPQLVPRAQPWRKAGWPTALAAAVEAALAKEQVRPPEGVSWADWERVLAARRAETPPPMETLRHLGPELEPEQVLVTVDEVLTRTQEKRHFWELRTARIVTPEGHRYVSGLGETFLQQVLVLLLLCIGPHRSLLLIADGARWIRAFYTDTLARVPTRVMLLDWYHVARKCADLGSTICRGRVVRAELLHRLYRRLWRGDVAAAVAVLEAQRPHAKNEEALNELIGYLQARAPFIPNYHERRRAQQYIGSGHVEKANDLLVARRQKGQGRHWSQETSAALAALRTLLLNGGWDLYWQHRQVLPLVATAA